MVTGRVYRVIPFPLVVDDEMGDNRMRTPGEAGRLTLMGGAAIGVFLYLGGGGWL